MKNGKKLDYFGKDASVLKKKKLFLFDVDGTLYTGESVFDGTFATLDYINRIQGICVYITNNSSRSVEDHIKKMARLGMKANHDNFFTSTQAAVLYLQQNHAGEQVYCQGTKSMIRELKAGGIDVTEEVCDAPIVLVGFDTEMTSEKIEKTCCMLNRENLYLATNPDLCCPVSFGFIPDCGSICQLLENATGRKPKYLGKPNPDMVDLLREKFHVSAEETVVVGDRLYTDIAAGNNAGVTSVCVLTGEATEQEILESSEKPDFTFCSIREFADLLNGK